MIYELSVRPAPGSRENFNPYKVEVEAMSGRDAELMVKRQNPGCTVWLTGNNWSSSSSNKSSSSSSSGGGFGLLLIGCIVIFGLNVFSSNDTSVPTQSNIEQTR